MRRLMIRSAMVGCLLSLPQLAAAAAYTFSTADYALPSSSGGGLNGSIWTDVDVDSLAAARTYVATNVADADFTASEVDYPAGSTGSISTDATFSEALGADAASLSNPAVAATTVLNSILRFDGYLRVDAPGSLFLGVGSDDGSELVIQGTQVIANDGIHPFPGAGAGPIEIDFLEAGLYGMEVLFFESNPIGWGVEFFSGSPGAGTPVAKGNLYGGPGTPVVPLPAALPMLLSGLIGLVVLGRRRYTAS